MSTNRKMTLVLIAVMAVVGVFGYLVGHNADSGGDSALRTTDTLATTAATTGTAATTTTTGPTGPTTSTTPSAPPSVKPTGNTPAALCAAAPNVVVVPTPAVELTFSTATWRSCTTEDIEGGAGHGGVGYTVKNTVPLFWSANQAVDALNAAIKKKIDDETAAFLKSVNEATPDDQTGGAPFTLSESPRINQVGRLAVIQMTGEEYVGGAHGGVIDDWINIDTDTWTILGNDQILLPGADQPSTATKLANLIAPKIRSMNGSSSCSADAPTLLAGGQMPEGTPTPGSFEKSMSLGLQSGGELVVDFPPYFLWSYGCGVGSAALSLDDLRGLINSQVVTLATAQVPPEVAPTFPGK